MTKCAFVAVAAGAAFAGVSSATVFTTQASFVAQLQAGFYLENFASVPTGSVPSLNFSSGGFSYTVSATGPGTNNLFNDPGIISTDSATDAILVTFTGGAPTAVGGNMWSTDINFQPFAAAMTITLSDGQTRSFNSSSASDFTGFTSGVAITSILIDAADTGGNAWATLDNLYVGRAIPTPGAAALMGVAGLAGLRRRR
ncbi:MAG: hypothetical protein AB7G17_02725 [Phycisphaerales bacterium]